jgi:undecaprenyl-phosphate 4-deoxy-4-formamido-L-arabinose transferase
MSESAPEISIVVPIYNEEATIERLMERLVTVLEDYGKPFEIVAVDDGSRDGSVELLRKIRARDARLRVIRLSRNFGQSPALYAGFSQVRGKYAVMIDADLQNFPEDIPRLVEKLEEGYDMVSGWREDRHDSLLRKLFSRALNWYVARITGVPLHDVGCALKAFRRAHVDQMAQFSHRCRYLPVDMAYLGGRIAEVKVQHAHRAEGVSKYSPIKLVRTAFDIITSVTAEPLQFIGITGWIFALLGFAMSLRVAWYRLNNGDTGIEAVIAIFFFIAGIQLVATGLTCEYISRLYVEVQKKPYFIIREELE